MFLYQTSMQKPLEQQQPSVKVFTGKDAQRILQQGVMPVCEQMLSSVHGKPAYGKPNTF